MRRPALALAWLSGVLPALCGVLHLARAAEPPVDADLLEFLGSVGSDDGDWHQYLAGGTRPGAAGGEHAPSDPPAPASAPPPAGDPPADSSDKASAGHGAAGSENGNTEHGTAPPGVSRT